MASLELYGRQVASGVVATLGVIEHLDVVEDIGPGLIARRIGLPANALSLEQLEEALCDCVVMAVAAPAHAAHQVVVAQEALPVMAGELGVFNRSSQHFQSWRCLWDDLRGACRSYLGGVQCAHPVLLRFAERWSGSSESRLPPKSQVRRLPKPLACRGRWACLASVIVVACHCSCRDRLRQPSVNKEVQTLQFVITYNETL
jgi:hypothetical protein